MTGGDTIQINPKGKELFSYTPRAKYIFGSQNEPAISSENADVRRLILCPVEPPKGAVVVDTRFEKQLHAEGGDFLKSCIEAYQSRYPERSHPPIEVDESFARELAMYNEGSLEEIFEQWFTIYADEPKVLAKDKPFTSRTDFNKALNKIARRHPSEHYLKNDLMKYLKRRHNIKSSSVRLDDNRREWRYLNLGLNPQEPPPELKLARKLGECMHNF
jgi:hypothetical protein